MYIFFISVFAIYSFIHLYVFLKVKKAFLFSFRAGMLLVCFMLVMTFVPFIVRVAERQGLDLFARALSYFGYSWMGLIFLFLSFSLVMDGFRLTVRIVELFLGRSFSPLKPTARLNLFIPLFCAVFILIFGFFEARAIRIEKITLRTPKIPEESGRLRIAQISDVHAGLIVREERLKRILTAVEEVKPDILVSTGDLVDGQIDNLSNLSAMLRDIKPRYGKFAITGNHEYYAGLEQALLFTETSGFTLLRGEGVVVNGLINIAGVDDPAGKRYNLYTHVSETELLSSLPREKFTILLKHRPIVDREALGLFDLQLSGHTHKGQIFPFNLVTMLYYPTHAGFLSIDGDASLYVSRGSGTWGPPIRFLSPPEVTIIDLLYGPDS
ncbi:metallophosphoesterase [bacterium]|nr:MAG: metallophosphoesterase [bacterium]